MHVAIETYASQTYPIPAVLKQVCGADSLATLKGGIGPAQHMQQRRHALAKNECERIPERIRETQRIHVKLLMRLHCICVSIAASISVFLAPLMCSRLLSRLVFVFLSSLHH